MSTQSHTVVNCGIDSGGIYHTTHLVQSRTARSVLVHGITFIGKETRPICVFRESDDGDMEVVYVRIIGMVWLLRIDRVVLILRNGMCSCVKVSFVAAAMAFRFFLVLFLIFLFLSFLLIPLKGTSLVAISFVSISSAIGLNNGKDLARPVKLFFDAHTKRSSVRRFLLVAGVYRHVTPCFGISMGVSTRRVTLVPHPIYSMSWMCLYT